MSTTVAVSCNGADAEALERHDVADGELDGRVAVIDEQEAVGQRHDALGGVCARWRCSRR
jgi:hypothetical protein